MLNYIWAAMIIVAVIYGAITGNIKAVNDAALDSAGEAVSLCITMMGVMALWVGLMEIAQTSGMIRKLTNGIQPFISFMFPKIPKEHVAREYIATNVIANVLGLGWACTPAGLKAMEALADLETERGNPAYSGARKKEETGNAEKTVRKMERAASREMCTFLVLNISSLQLIPVNMIVYRSQYGSVNPTAVILPAIVATCISTVAAIAFCKVMEK